MENDIETGDTPINRNSKINLNTSGDFSAPPAAFPTRRIRAVVGPDESYAATVAVKHIRRAHRPPDRLEKKTRHTAQIPPGQYLASTAT
ncbi:MAG TPA: hypothetical protein ENN65_00580 [Candidatus Hydrogenedentes bacterium]|nr:hypothetical protein [Candidatus Hydrogenedentota bacterium]